jgi:hypothetical protein
MEKTVVENFMATKVWGQVMADHVFVAKRTSLGVSSTPWRVPHSVKRERWAKGGELPRR